MHVSYLSPIFVTFVALLVAVQAITIPVQERAISIPKKPSLGGKRGPTQSQITTTCSRFRSACIKAALSGKKSGKHAIVYDCYKKKPKNKKYFFGCRIGKKDYTTQALNILSGGSTSTIYTADSTTTKTTTNTQLTSTTSTFTSTQTNTETDFTTDEFSSTTTSTVDETTTQPQTLVESYTTTETTTIQVPTTVVLTNTVTSTSFSTSYTSVGDFFPVVDYQIITNSARRRSIKLDDSSFCKAYSSACNRQCGRVSSTPKHQVCHQKSTNRFSLSCVCKNKKVETQHALADIGDDQYVTSVSTIATSSATATITSTVVVPTTVVTTQMTTTTSHVPVTSTIISTVTSTGTVTDTTTTSTTATASATSFTTVPVTTTTATETATVSATTVVVIAPTGVVKATYSDGTPPRYISRQDTTNRGLNTLVSDITQAEPVIFVADTTTGLYALQYISGGQFLSLEQGASYSPNVYGFLVGANGRAAGPAGGVGPWQSRVYESYVYSIAANSITTAGIPIQGTWIQPDNSQYTVYFLEDNESPNRYILVAGSTTLFSDSFPLLSLSVVPQS